MFNKFFIKIGSNLADKTQPVAQILNHIFQI